MSDKIEKIARKPSSDPAQEKLRQDKDSWNEAVKSLISRLIAFKRGLNGRGDAKASLPPTNIKDPFPSEIGSYLNEVANEYIAVVNGAHSIIQEQAQYSQNRRKSQRVANLEFALIKQATWWGSRLWARVALRKLNRNLRVIRFRMIKDGLELLKEFKKLEVDLSQKNPDSIPNGITQANLLVIHLQSYLEKYDELIMESSRAEAFTSAEKGTSPEGQEKSKDALPQELQTVVTAPEDDSAWGKFQNYWNEHEYIGQIVNALQNSPTMLDVNKTTMRSSYNEFENIGALLKADSKNPQLDQEKLDELFGAFFAQYDYLLTLAKNQIGNGNNFAQLSKLLPRTTIASYLKFKNNKKELQKIAASALERWLMKQRLSFMADSQDRFTLEAIENSETARKKLGSIIDLLESPTASLKQIDAEIVLFVGMTQKVLMMIHRLGKIHMTSGRRKSKNKDSYMSQVGKTELNQLEQMVKDLNEYAQPLVDEKNE